MIHKIFLPISLSKGRLLPLPDERVDGIDTSFWDMLVWNSYTRKYDFVATWQPKDTPNIKFHIRKSTQANFMDPAYLQSLARIGPCDFETCYHFFDPRCSALEQANVLVSKFKLGAFFNLPPVLDLEWYFNYTRRELTRIVMHLVDLVDTAIGVPSIIYTNANFWNNHMENVYIADHPLWVANYYRSTPYMPRGWRDWVMWQYTDKGCIPGLLGGIDMDYGKLAALQAVSARYLRHIHGQV